MKYEIFIDYGYGDSYNHYEATHEELGIIVADIDTARLVISYLEEHYKAVQYYEKLSYKESEEFLSSLVGKPWYVPESYWTGCARLPLDASMPGYVQQISLPYTGYFNSLHKVYAEPYMETDGLSFSPRSY